MERGYYRGARRRSADEVTQPRRLALAANSGTTQTGITTVTDLTGLAFSFTIGVYPVRLRLYEPYIYGSIAGDGVALAITDSAGTLIAESVYTVPTNNGGGFVLVEHTLTTAGVYSVKGRIRRSTGTGNVNTYVDANYVAFIEATEVRV